MVFINSVVQRAFLNLLCTRRGKRSKYCADTHIQIRQKANFDKCIIMIASHHPHIWSYGTGNLLVAPMIPTPEILTKAAERANEWRSESLKEHDIDGILDEGFGYFIRYTLECRERLSVYKMFRKLGYEATLNLFEQQYGCTPDICKYIDCVAPQLYDLISNIKVVCHRGKSRYGDDKFNQGNLTNEQSIYEIIKECNQRPNIKVLRKFMVDIIDLEFVTETLSTLVIPESLLYADKETECVVCLQEKDVLMWPCHTSHVTCAECTIELVSRRVSCPICRMALEFRYGKWYMRKPT
jgi:hypothetical protein